MHGSKWYLAAALAIAACGGGQPSTTGPSPSPSSSPEPARAPVVVPLPGEPGPGAEGAEVVVVARAAQVDATGWLRLDGRLANRGDRPASAVGLRVRLYDGLGLLLDTREAIVTPGTLAPGEEATFALVAPPPSAPLSVVTVQPRWQAASSSPSPPP